MSNMSTTDDDAAAFIRTYLQRAGLTATLATLDAELSGPSGSTVTKSKSADTPNSSVTTITEQSVDKKGIESGTDTGRTSFVPVSSVAATSFAMNRSDKLFYARSSDQPTFDYQQYASSQILPPSMYPMAPPPAFAGLPGYPQALGPAGPHMLLPYAMAPGWFHGFPPAVVSMGTSSVSTTVTTPAVTTVAAQGRRPADVKPPTKALPPTKVSGQKRSRANFVEADDPKVNPAPAPSAAPAPATDGKRVRMSTAHIAPEPDGRFRCPFEDCGKLFTHRTNLRRHLMSHSGYKPFVCEQCHRGFTRSDDLTIHLRTHTGDRPFRCPQCSRSFIRSSDLNVHMKLHGVRSSRSTSHGSHSSGVGGEVDEGHVHGIDCGHKPVLYDGQIAFLLEDGLLATEDGCVPYSAHSGDDLHEEDAHTHDANHIHHAATCGHPIVRHDDHFDYWVDGALHHVDDDCCVVHGTLDEIDQETLGVLSGLDGLKSTTPTVEK